MKIADLAPLLVFAAIALEVGAGFNHRILSNDESFIISGAQRILAGQVPYRDFYAYVGIPATFYLYAAILKLTGSLLAPRVVSAILHGLLAALAFIAIRRITKSNLWASTSLLLAVIYRESYYISMAYLDYKVVATFLAFISMMLLFEKKDARSGGRRGLIAGFLCAVSLLFKYTLGGSFLVAGAVSLAVLKEWRQLAHYCAGAALALGIFGAYILASGALPQFSYQTIDAGSSYLQYLVEPLGQALRDEPFTYAAHLLALTVLATSVILIVKAEMDESRKRLAVITTIFTLGLIGSLYPIPSAQYLLRGMPFLLVLAAYCLSSLLRPETRRVFGAARPLLILFILVLLGKVLLGWGTTDPGVSQFSAPYAVGQDTFMLTPEHVELLNSWNAVIRKANATSLFDYTGGAKYNLFLGLKNPARCDYWVDRLTPDYESGQAMDALERDRTLFVASKPLGKILDAQKKIDYARHEKQLELEGYILANYDELVITPGGPSLYRRKP